MLYVIKRNKIYSWLGALLLAVLLAGGSSLWPAAPAAVAAEHVALTWQGDPLTTQTITWKSAAGQPGKIEYARHTGGAQPKVWQEAAAAEEELSTNEGAVHVYSAALTGLQPDTLYEYRVINGQEASSVYSFKTAPAAPRPFKFLIFGDSQSSDYSVWGATAKQAYQANADAVFFTNMGDLVDVGQDYKHWRGWFAGAAGVAEYIPMMPIVGNHETYTPWRQFSRPVLFTGQIKLPQHGPEGLKGQVYSFDYGDVHLVMLDSQEGEEKSFTPAMVEQQRQWLEDDLQRSTKTWKLVFMHRSPYGNKPGRVHSHLQEAWVPVFEQYGVDVVFTAHDHVYARTMPLQQGKAGGAGGIVYTATGRSGTKFYRDVVQMPYDEFFYNPTEGPIYLTAEVGSGTLTVNAYKQQGEMISSWQMKK